MTTRAQDPTPAEQPEEPTTSSKGRNPKLVAPPMTWGAAPGETTASPTSLSPGGLTAGGDSAGAGSPGPSDEPPASKPKGSGGSRTSSPVDSPEHVEKAIRSAVIGGTEAAHEFLVHDPVAKDVELLVADDEDADGIAQPGARLLARRLTSGINNPDLADGIELAIAVGAYIAKQLRKLQAVRRARRAEAASLEDLAEQAGEPVGA